MPALSPTMEAGTLASWSVKEGDSFAAGDVLAKIETDKASIDFEAQDDGHVAKLLIPDGSEDVVVGVPIMITVEEAEHTGAFADYTPPAAEEEPAPAAEEPAPVESSPPPPEPVVAAEPPPPPPAAAPVAPEPTPAVETPVPAAVEMAIPTMGPAWGSTARVTSPIAKTLAAKQQAYVEAYGTTGQLPL